jgi:NADH:ubiquinone oxidoreductase subunit 2 (subunit N)
VIYLKGISIVKMLENLFILICLKHSLLILVTGGAVAAGGSLILSHLGRFLCWYRCFFCGGEVLVRIEPRTVEVRQARVARFLNFIIRVVWISELLLYIVYVFTLIIPPSYSLITAPQFFSNTFSFFDNIRSLPVGEVDLFVMELTLEGMGGIDLRPNMYFFGFLLFIGWIYHLYVNYWARAYGVKAIYQLILNLYILVVIFLVTLMLFTYDLLFLIIVFELLVFVVVGGFFLPFIGRTKADVKLAESMVTYFMANAFSALILTGALLVLTYLGGFGNLMILSDYFLFFRSLVVLREAGWWLCVALLLLFLAILFKIGAAPFSSWLVNAYTNAEPGYIFFLLNVVGPSLLCKYAELHGIWSDWFLAFPVLNVVPFLFGLVSIIVGTIRAYGQEGLMPFLVFTGISHIGYMLLFISINDMYGLFGFVFYLGYYVLLTLAFFSIYLYVLIFAASGRLETIRQLAVRVGALVEHPRWAGFGIGITFAIIVLTYVGIPPLGGFFMKFYLLVNALAFSDYLTSFFLIVTFVINGYLYLRFIALSFFNDAEVDQELDDKAWAGRYALLQEHRSLWCSIYYFLIFFSVFVVGFLFFYEETLWVVWKLVIFWWLQ